MPFQIWPFSLEASTMDNPFSFLNCLLFWTEKKIYAELGLFGIILYGLSYGTSGLSSTFLSYLDFWVFYEETDAVLEAALDF